jgi:hypothetical protein
MIVSIQKNPQNPQKTRKNETFSYRKFNFFITRNEAPVKKFPKNPSFSPPSPQFLTSCTTNTGRHFVPIDVLMPPFESSRISRFCRLVMRIIEQIPARNTTEGYRRPCLRHCFRWQMSIASSSMRSRSFACWLLWGVPRDFQEFLRDCGEEVEVYLIGSRFKHAQSLSAQFTFNCWSTHNRPGDQRSSIF